MKVAYTLGFISFTVFSVHGQAALYGQCGGKNWAGPTTCVSGAVCTYQNDFYWQCIASVNGTGAGGTPTEKNDCTTPSATNGVAVYGQCGGKVWTGPTTCVSGAVCTYQNDYYSQCLPVGEATGTGGSIAKTATSSRPSATTSPSMTKTPPSTTTTPPSTTATPPSTTTPSYSNPTTTKPSTSASTSATQTGSCSATPPASTGKLRHAGVNIAGFDFGTGTDGYGVASNAYAPLPQYNGADGPGQMAHFVKDDGYNTFRLPVMWQFLTDNDASGNINQEYFAKYDALVKACRAVDAYCILDIHNYARWDGQIIGQGGPTNEVFASFWGSLASHYASDSKIIFGIMNEPHELPSIESWAETVQAAVTAIRKAGATTQIILLPGDNYASAKTFVSNGSAAALAKVTNSDGSHTNLVFDVHRYLDSDGSGTSDTCVTDDISETWEPLAQWLRCNGRQVLITETGGGNTPSCEKYMCQQIKYLAENSDVILGYVGWAAGSFDASYTLTETPTKNGDAWKDQSLVTTCMAPVVNGCLA